MKLFGFELKKATETKSVSSVYSSNGINLDGKSIARNFGTYGKMWRINTDIRRCVAEKCETAMRGGFELQKVNKTDGVKKVAYDPDFLDALGNVGELKTKIITTLEIFGDVFIRRKRNIRKKVIGYEVLDTRYISIVTDSFLVPIRYLYERRAQNTYAQEVYTPEDIFHASNGYNFDNVLFGVTIMETLVLDVLGDEEANLVNYFWFENDAMPSSLYVLKDGMLEDQQRETIENIKSTLKGGHNKGKSIMTNGVSDVKPIAQPHTDASFLEQRRYVTEKVCAGFGVPRSVLGYIEDVNYANGDIQLKKFIENTIMPLEKRLEEIFTTLSQDFLGFNFVINSNHIDQLEQLSLVARENVNAGLWTRNEAREYMGWDKIDEELADELTVNASVQLIDNLLLGEPVIEETPEQI